MARTKAAGFETQRAAIRDAATRLFAEKGYASASIADLARACGVDRLGDDPLGDFTADG